MWRWFHTVFVIGLLALSTLTGLLLPLSARLWGWLLIMAFFVLILGTLGSGIFGRFWGVLVDERNAISLSRLQIAVWTILILSGFVTAALNNLSHELVAHPTDIAIPQQLWLLMGISTTSLVGSPLIKQTKKTAPAAGTSAAEAAAALPEGKRAVGTQALNDTPDLATFGDIFKGEEVGNQSQVDMGKVQMFYFTFVLVAVYGVALGYLLGGPNAITEFPDLDQSMIALLGISHAGYLTYKALPHS